VSVDSNAHNCGACGVDCEQQVANVTSVSCGAGQCDYAMCAMRWGDCDGDRKNGCETPLADPAHCGTCATNCATLVHNANMLLCPFGACDYTSCDAGWADCDGNRANGCELAVLAHANGVGGSYYDCYPLGTPGNAATYVQAMAQDACVSAGMVCFVSPQANCQTILGSAGATYRVWSYAGQNVGRMFTTTNPNVAQGCPSASGAQWD
jgi:hypothetical protein